MRPQQPPLSPAWQVSQELRAGAERIGSMVKGAADLAIELGLGGSPNADRIVAELLADLRAVVPDLARERSCGPAMARLMLDGMADHIETAANHRATWPRHSGNRLPLPGEANVRALISRLRLVARN